MPSIVKNWQTVALLGLMLADAGPAYARQGHDPSMLGSITLQTPPSPPQPAAVTARPSAASALLPLWLGAAQPESTAEPAEEPTSAATGAGTDELAKKLQNPVADLISLPIQVNYDHGYGDDDAGRVTVNVQPVIPFELNEEWNLISRTIVPLIYQEELSSGDDEDAGVGDVVQSLFFSPKEPVRGWILGAGPVFLLPTGTDPQLRSEQFGIGPTAVALRQEHGWTYGALVNHLWGITESDDHPDVNATFLQPFASYTWPTATTLTLNLESTYDWTAEEWTIPANLMLSQLTNWGGQPVSLQGGVRYYLDAPDGGPEWGLRFNITFLFPN